MVVIEGLVSTKKSHVILHLCTNSTQDLGNTDMESGGGDVSIGRASLGRF